ncbi:hypothetical protein GQX74_014589 [Glossina fuscipes]|nr:hypothetical protein GQX74_014589 [Glossina fuscipes]
MWKICNKIHNVVKFRKRASPSASCAREAIYKKSTALTSFFVFLDEYRRKLKKNRVRIRQAELCRAAGMKWRRLTDCEKKPYVTWAENNREQLRHTSGTRSKLNLQHRVVIKKRNYQVGRVEFNPQRNRRYFNYG